MLGFGTGAGAFPESSLLKQLGSVRLKHEPRMMIAEACAAELEIGARTLRRMSDEYFSPARSAHGEYDADAAFAFNIRYREARILASRTGEKVFRDVLVKRLSLLASAQVLFLTGRPELIAPLIGATLCSVGIPLPEQRVAEPEPE